jgi:uncharacterized membrane protein YfcA
VIGILLIIFGVNLVINGVKGSLSIIENRVKFNIFKNNEKLSFLLFGLIIGFSSGFLGVGSSGSMAITLVVVFGYDLHTAIGSSLLMMFFISGSGSLGHVLNNEYIINPVIFAGTGAAFGALLGSFYANRVDEEKLGKVIGVIAIFLGLVFILKIFV